MPPDPNRIHVIVATDCGSTTTKAILFEKVGDVYRQTYRGEAPTTVEAPIEDVTNGVVNALQELQELSGRRLLDESGQIVRPARRENGVEIGCDVYISTSSAGGGLQMMVAGVVRQMTAESAERAALGAGAIVMDTIASNDKRLPHQQIERIRQLRPDMIVLAGLTDDTERIGHVVTLAELIAAADPRPRLGSSYKLPVIYAGTKQAQNEIEERLAEKTDLDVVPNLRPVLERENLGPTRDKIHDLFMEHVMQQAPGYKKLMDWTDVPIMPTPAAVGLIIQTIGKQKNINVVGVDIGGATTDVFSVFGDAFNRTVSANLGMSYSIANVFKEAGLANVLRWVPFAINERELRNAIKNKMIRPTTIPQRLADLVLEQAVAKEALRLAFIQHRSFATKLKGVQQERTISDAFDSCEDESVVDMMALDLIVGSGGVLSHAPRRTQTAMMLLDAYQPQGVTMLAVDSIFMMPHLGVLSQLHPQAATEVFERDCMIYLGPCVVPVGASKSGKKILALTLTREGGTPEHFDLMAGELKLIPLGVDEHARLELEPARGFDVGAGRGKRTHKRVSGGVVGLLLDGRGRPLELPEDETERAERLKKWMGVLDVYPNEKLEKLN